MKSQGRNLCTGVSPCRERDGNLSRILVWSPNYAPELIGIAPLATDLSRWLASRGHEVHVVTAFPNYPERRIHKGYERRFRETELDDNVSVHRFWLRVRPRESLIDKGLYEASFAAFSAPRALELLRRADVALCVIPTLLTAGAGALAARFTKSRSVLWIQDLVLDAAHAIGPAGKARAAALNAFRSVESLALRNADRVISASPGFVPYLQGRGADPSRIDVIPNWVDVNEFAALPEPPASRGVRFVYAGNIGYTQGFETLFRAADIAVDDIDVVVVGDGNTAKAVRHRSGDSRVQVRPLVARSRYPQVLASAHALIVLQRKEAANVNLPSKIATYLASGRPIVASIAPDSPAAAMLESSGGAIVVPPEDPVALAGAMTRLRDDAALRVELGGYGRAYALQHLAKEAVPPESRAFSSRVSSS